MPIFDYVALDRAGTEVSGQIDAVDSRAAREQLETTGLKPSSLSPVESARDAGASRSVSSVASDDTLELTAHLAELTAAKVPLAPGLLALARDMPRGRLATVIERLAAHLQRGMALEAAAEMPDVRLPAHVRNLLACGLRAGQLGLVLEQFLAHQRMSRELQRRLWSALAYPMLLLVLLAAWLMFVVVLLVKDMRIVYQDFNIELPASTKSILWAADYGPRAIVMTMAGLAVALLMLRFVAGGRWLSVLLANVPLFGPLWRDRGLAEFASLLGLFLDHATPLPKALKLTAEGLNDAELAAACDRSAHLAEGGRRLADCLASTRVFPPTLLPIVAWGDRLSAQPEALRSAAKMFRTRTELRSRFLSVVLPPISFVLIAATVLYVVVGLFMPLIHLIQALAR